MNKKHLLLTTLLSAVTIGMTAVPAAAQTDDDDEIIVTGSRLTVNPNLASANPVLSVNSDEIGFRGTVNIEDLTNSLPQVFAGQASEVSNGASGTSNLNLRGLGSVRTLTMIDGRRLPYGSSGSSAANLDLVPTNLVERVDILTGGASAVYGSDAIGGVANFILKDDFEGVELDAQFGISHNENGVTKFDEVLRAGNQPVPGESFDGEEFNFSLTVGANSPDGKGNVTMFAAYQDRSEITQDNRSISGCALGLNTGAASANGYACVGSANFRAFGTSLDRPSAGFGFQEEDGTIVPFVGGPLQTFNFGPFNFFQRPAERLQLYTRANYEIAPDHRLFADASFVNNLSDAQIAPSASFGRHPINCGNPFIQGTPGLDLATLFGCTADDIANDTVLSSVFASHRNVEGGARNSRLENSAWRVVAGVEGTVFKNWDYEVFAQYNATRDQSISTNDFVVSRIAQAFNVVLDANGNPVCADPSGGCVPYNIFQRTPEGGSLVTQDALDFIQGVGIVNGQTEQTMFGGTLQSDLGEYGISSPMTENGVGLLVGFETRTDRLDSDPDEISQVPGGGFTGVGGATLPVEGNVSVNELFAEVQVPLVTDRPFFNELVLQGQYRYSDYTASGNGIENDFSTDAYGVQLSWAPVEDIKLRGQYQRAVRAPNVIELFTGQNTNLPNLTARPSGLFDPCATATPDLDLATCARTGVTAAQFGNILDVISGQTQSITGGNPLLDPEVSDTITLGAVFTPTRFIEGLTASVDYFDIEIEDTIAAGIPAQTILDNCLATGDAAFCSLVTRDGAGSLNAGTAGVGFQQTNINIAELSTSGFDLQVNYLFDLDRFNKGNWGDFAIQYAATILTSLDTVPFPGADVIECEGFHGGQCGTPNPEYRHRALLTWNTPYNAQITATWRHFQGTDLPGAVASAPSPDDRIGTRDYLDLSGNYEFVEGITLRAGVLNALNKQAPVFTSAGPPFGNGNTFPTVFDTGRFIFMGVNLKL